MNTVKDLWDGYAEEILPPNAPEIQRRETKRAFYAGCWAYFMLVSLTSGHSDDAGVAMIEEWRKEMLQFVEDVKAGRA